ncbi:hypothetical protein SteCoe_34790 [Stentor coeruleus]|uniref:Tyrosine-protein kinase ephrin type A/B receptor-like domain-containing protein n=1 Tax=Stentor coeruleus TaxID=5963 RepID=A0A1R2ATZ0_9CILI|nr:hypothetical protein SteCoe_34790 [Stentor coeruleus]
MNLINGKFYLFGGKGDNKYYNDLWVYNPILSLWSALSSLGNIPSSRADHAADSQGDTLIIWGGEDSLGLRSDLFMFNAISNYWYIITPASDEIPNPARGSCMVVSIPHVYIYGGVTNTGVSNELWDFNLWNNKYTKLSSDEAFSYGTCALYEGHFYVILGSKESSIPKSRIRIYSLKLNLWFKYYEIFDGRAKSSQAIQIFINGTVFKIGGQAWETEPKNDIWLFDKNYYPENYTFYNKTADNSTQIIQKLGDVPVYSFKAAYVYYNMSIYVFGGGSVSGNTLRMKVPNSDFFSISMKDICGDYCPSSCSGGTYEGEDVCSICPAGSYSEGIGNSTCTLCPVGTYNGIKGGSSNRQCYPCPEGSFANKPGSPYCLNCPAGLYCPPGSNSAIDLFSSDISYSIQPSLYKTGSSSSQVYYYEIAIGVFMLIVTIIVLSTKKCRERLYSIDIYNNLHNYVIGEPMYMRVTFFGGLFTLFFITIALIIIGATIISYEVSNIQETKSLVPLAILENEVSDFTADRMIVKVEFMRYGENCTSDILTQKCVKEVTATISNVANSANSINCEYTQDKSCIVKYMCKDCILKVGAKMSLLMTGKLSYAAGIIVNVTSTSSIPGAISSIVTDIYPNKNYVFIGASSNDFYFTMTPSLFKSDASKWKSDTTGYHVSSEKAPNYGSQHLTTELPVAFKLEANIYLNTGIAGLLTYRFVKQTLLFLFSSLLGSVFGVMGAMGGGMKFVEKNLYKIKNIVKRKKHVKDVKGKRKGLTIVVGSESSLLNNEGTCRQDPYDEVAPDEIGDKE